MRLQKFKRITGRRELAETLKTLVLEEDHYDQEVWVSPRYFDGISSWEDDRILPAEELRAILSEPVEEYTCGTKGCIAGNTAILTMPGKSKYDYDADEVVDKDGRRTHVKYYAQAKLGLNDKETSWLFHSDRSKDEVVAALDLIISGKRRIAQLIPEGWW